MPLAKLVGCSSGEQARIQREARAACEAGIRVAPFVAHGDQLRFAAGRVDFGLLFAGMGWWRTMPAWYANPHDAAMAFGVTFRERWPEEIRYDGSHWLYWHLFPELRYAPTDAPYTFRASLAITTVDPTLIPRRFGKIEQWEKLAAEPRQRSRERWG
jgi:hypothetical protein